jgi:hypothetical protein
VVMSAAPRDRLVPAHPAAILQKPLDYDRLLQVVRAHC